MVELKKVREFLEDWLKSTQGLINYVERILDISYDCESVEEFEEKAKELIEQADIWHKEELQSIVRSAIDSR